MQIDPRRIEKRALDNALEGTPDLARVLRDDPSLMSFFYGAVDHGVAAFLELAAEERSSERNWDSP